MPDKVLESYSDIGVELSEKPDYSDIGVIVQEDIPQLKEAPKDNFIDKIKSFFRSPDEDIAKAQNVYALSKLTGLQLKDVYDNYDVLRKSSKITGISSEIEAMEFLSLATIPVIATSAVVNPVGTAAGLLAFGAIDKAIPTDEWLDKVELGSGTEKTIQLLDFIGKGLIVGGVFKKAPGLADKYLKSKLIEYKLGKDISLSSKQVADIFQTGKLTTPEEKGLFAGLGMNRTELKKAIKQGVKISIPAEKLTTVVDKPIWAKIKSVLGKESKPQVISELAGKPKQGVSGLLEKQVEVKKLSPAIKIPEFKSTEEALEFGIRNKDVPGIKEALQANREEIQARSQALQDTDENEAFRLAQVSQFPREAIEAIEGKIPDKWIKKAQVKVSGEQAVTQPKAEGAKATPPKGLSGLEGIEEQAKSIESSEEIALSKSPQQEIIKTSEVVPSQKSMEQERGFVKTVRESSMVGKETKEKIAELPAEITSYDVYSDKEAVAKAKDRIDANAEESLSYVLTSNALDKDVTTTGIELMRRYREQGNVEQEVNVAATLAEKGTKAGQFIQAYSILNKLSPDGVLVFAQREINRGIEEPNKRKIIEPELADKLKNQAKIIQETPYGYQKVKEISKLMEMISKKKGKSAKDWITDFINVPRTLMSSMLDFSFGFRQGLFLLPSFPKEWGIAFSKQFGAFAKESNYDALMDSIMKHPDYGLAENSGIAFTDIRSDFGKLEEQYMGANLAEKIPIIGGVVRATNRAYTGMANKMRMDIFSKMVQDMENIGIEPRNNKRLLQEIATFVNAGTGRGGLGGVLQQSAPLLNGIFYSPRLMSSRLTLLNPQYYITRQPGLRKQAIKSLFSFMGLWGTVLALAKMMGAEVGTDPRSSDFGKIRINNTRIDFGGGFAQWMRMFGQQITGEYVSSTTGKKLTLGEGYKPLTRYDILIRQLESKEAPVVSFITDILRQQDYAGNKIDITKEVTSRFIPMIAQDIYDLVQEDPELLPLGLLPVFGVGLQTYKQKKKNKF